MKSVNIKKSNLEYIYDEVGKQEVGLYDNKPTEPNKSTDEPVTKMRFKDYIIFIKSKPSGYSIFFYNITDHLLELLKNFRYLNLGFKYFKRIPTLYFGGSEPHVLMHYNIDYENLVYRQYPTLKYAEGYEILMEHGDALFMPSTYWNFNRYLEAGFSMTLRSLPSYLSQLTKIGNDISLIRKIDKIIHQI